MANKDCYHNRAVVFLVTMNIICL